MDIGNQIRVITVEPAAADAEQAPEPVPQLEAPAAPTATAAVAPAR